MSLLKQACPPRRSQRNLPCEELIRFWRLSILFAKLARVNSMHDVRRFETPVVQTNSRIRYDFTTINHYTDYRSGWISRPSNARLDVQPSILALFDTDTDV